MLLYNTIHSKDVLYMSRLLLTAGQVHTNTYSTDNRLSVGCGQGGTGCDKRGLGC